MLFMKLKERFLRILFPSRCIGCDRVISFGSDLCPSCAESLCKTEIDLADACKNSERALHLQKPRLRIRRRRFGLYLRRSGKKRREDF